VCILGFGVLWGYMARIIPEKGDSYVVPLRTILLLCGGLVAVYGSELIHFEGAGPLAVVFAAFVSQYHWIEQGWTLEESPVGTAFEIFWMIFEPILFGITGATVKIDELDPGIVSYGLISLVAGAIVRIIATTLISFGDKLNWKERVSFIMRLKLSKFRNISCSGVCLTLMDGKGDSSSCSRSTRPQASQR
jgi:solute carrier family 9B (sodium/hydrogen exchanger), member 1/2